MTRSRWGPAGRELALVVVLYAAYLAGRGLMDVQRQAAHLRGEELLGLEAVLHLDVERPLNALVTSLPPVGLAFAYLYATLHYVITPVALGWVALRRRHGYRHARTALVVMTVVGLVLYWLLPTAPPRLLDAGFTDTLAQFSEAGWWGDAASAPKGLEGLSNEYAAMPSLHVGWAVWVALVVGRHTGRRWAWAYPALMTVVVMATSNHYLLDAVAGALCALLGWWVAGRVPELRRGRVPVPARSPARCG